MANAAAKEPKPKKSKPVKAARPKPRKAAGQNGFNIMTAPVLCVLYPVAALLLIVVYRLIFPAGIGAPGPQAEILPVYRANLCFTEALLDWIELFPALILSALVMPFGLKPDFEAPEKRFSASFLNRLKPCVITAMAAAAVLAVLTMIARPALYNHGQSLRVNSLVYHNAKKQAEEYAGREDWTMATGFLALCKKIWTKDNPGIAALEQTVLTGRQALLYTAPRTGSGGTGGGSRFSGGAAAGANAGRESGRGGGGGGAGAADSGGGGAVLERGLPGQKKPVNATQAVEFARKAMEEKRFFDAHWLATLASHISAPGTVENAAGQRIAAEAWQRISLPELTAEEARLNAIYQQKRSGYEALIAEDWIRAYYIFHELALLVPEDPDVAKYQELARTGLSTIMFFIDEMNMSAEKEIENAVFSIPRAAEGGRLVFRAGYLTALAGESYASRVEIAAFDYTGRPVFRVETPFAKIMPVHINNLWRSVILLRAVDRDDERVRWDPLWTEAGEEEAAGGGGAGAAAASRAAGGGAGAAASSRAGGGAGAVASSRAGGGAGAASSRAAGGGAASSRAGSGAGAAAASSRAAAGPADNGRGGYSLLLDIPYGDFLLAALPSGGDPDAVKGYYLADLWQAAARLDDYGFAPEVFFAEILRVAGSPLVFLPFAVFCIIAGWRFRSRHKPPFSGLLMAVILPIVFHAIYALVMTIVGNISVMLILAAGFTFALVASVLLALAALVVSILVLAAQHG